MTFGRLVGRGLVHYWRTNLAVIGGVATAVAVLAGALLVGDSVRGSLRDLVLQRLGATDYAVISSRYVGAGLADALRDQERVRAAGGRTVPLIAVAGAATEQASSRRTGNVRVYGVDDRFFAFHGKPGLAAPAPGEALISPALARDIGATEGAAILVRAQRPTDMPLESIHGRKDDVGRTSRAVVRRILGPDELGEFSIEAGQGEVRAAFLSLPALQRSFGMEGRVNAILLAVEHDLAPTDLAAAVTTVARASDLQLTIRSIDPAREISIGSDTGLLDEATEAAVGEALRRSGASVRPIFTYLVNTLTVGDREIPYSLVSAIDLPSVAPGIEVVEAPGAEPRPAIVLNAWAAGQLRARVGDRVSLGYYVWEEPGQLATRAAQARVAAIVPVDAADADFAPAYPGISDSPSLADWDPPFPVDLRRIRPVDEQYWDRYRTTPKAFIALGQGRALWGSRYGAVTSIRVPFQPGETAEAARARVHGAIAPAVRQLAASLAPRPVRAEALAASNGATDFGEYFVYFSFFIVVSALLLAALFFKLGIEQRGREVGLLRAVGFGPGAVRRLFLTEGTILAGAGSIVGAFGGIGYAALLMHGLRTWWVEAVGTTALTLHVTPLSLAAGGAGGLLAAVGCIWWTLRGLERISERSLLAGDTSVEAVSPRGRVKGLSRLAAACAAIGLGLMVLGRMEIVPAAGAFFGAGSALLVAMLLAFAVLVRRPSAAPLAGRGWPAVSRLGVRSTSYRPGRAVLSVAVMASATFILIAVDAFRRDAAVDASDRHGGTGGYPLIVETVLPVVHDPNTTEGRALLNLFDLDAAVRFEPVRLLPGDDASCLNLYEPRNPRVLGLREEFLAQGRFAFQSSLAESEAERENPWRLLDRREPDGAVPVIADANSLTYVLHRKLGDQVVMARDGREIRMRIVAALRDSIFQSELLMSEGHFAREFPRAEGYRVLLVDAPAAGVSELEEAIESTLVDFGADAVRTDQRLAEFHQVENTYLSTFQALGGLGLLLGTFGLGTVLLRNVLERRRELALLMAVGFERRHVALMVLAENLTLLTAGLVGGALCAALAIAPALAARGTPMPVSGSGGLLLATIVLVGVTASFAAVAAATRSTLLESLRSE